MRSARWQPYLLVALLMFFLLAAVARADNYGTSKAEASFSEKAVRAAFAPFGPGAQACAVRFMWRESGGNPRAANYRDSNGGSYGLLQLNGVHRFSGESLYQFQQRMWNIKTHLAAAVRLYRNSGFAPWGGC